MPRKPKRFPKGSNRSSSSAKGGEEHRLYLEPESPKTREIASRERARWGFHLGVCALVVCSLIALARATIREAFEKNPRFALKEVEVNTSGAVSPQKIVKMAGLTDGQNLLSINLREVRERIEEMPEVRSGSVRRDYKGKVTIAVEQRRPVAWLACEKAKLRAHEGDSSLLVDKDGVVVPFNEGIENSAALPVIAFSSAERPVPGQKIESPQFVTALKLVAEMKRRSTGPKLQIARIDIVNAYALPTTFTDGVEAVFGIDGLDQQLLRYFRIRAEAKERGWQIATLNLLAEDNIPVTFKNVASLVADDSASGSRRASSRTSSRRH